MLMCLGLALIGSLGGAKLDVRFIALFSLTIVICWIFVRIESQTIDVESILMLFAYLSAAQGGYLLGSCTTELGDN